VDPEVLSRARVLFFQSPSTDTDRLFELRTSDPVLFAEIHPYVDGSKLSASHPARAARYFALLMAARGAEARVGWKDAAEGRRPSLADLQRISDALPGRLWREMGDTWSRLDPGDLHTAHIGYDEGHRSLIAIVVDALGRDLALVLEGGELGWDELVASLPNPLRTIDRWLLVAVASSVEAQPLADRAWLWIDEQRTPRAHWSDEQDRSTLRRELSIEGLGRPATQVLARAVARHLSVHASSELRVPIEAWCAELGEDPYESGMTASFQPVSSGFDAEELARWSPDEWVRQLRAAPTRGGGRPPLEGAEDSAMPLLWSASLSSRTAAGTGDKVPQPVDPSLASAPREQLDLPRSALTATSDGDSLHAATSLEADARESLERLVISQCHWSASGGISITGAPPAGSVSLERLRRDQTWQDPLSPKAASCCARTAR